MAPKALRENGETGAFLLKDREAIEGFLGTPVVMFEAATASPKKPFDFVSVALTV